LSLGEAVFNIRFGDVDVIGFPEIDDALVEVSG
jgi:hypothetical protein